MAGEASTLNSSAPRRFRDRNVGIAVLCWIAFWTALGWIDRPDEAQLSAVLTVASGAAVTGFGAVGICRKLRCGVGLALSITIVAAFTYAPTLATLVAYEIRSRADLSASPHRIVPEWRLVWLLGSVAAGVGTSLVYSRGSRRLARLLTLFSLFFAGLYVLWADRQTTPPRFEHPDPWLPAPPSQTRKADLMLQAHLSTGLSEKFGDKTGETLLNALDPGLVGAAGLRALLRDGDFLRMLAKELRPQAVQVPRSEFPSPADDLRQYTRTWFAEDALCRKGKSLWKKGRIPDGALLMSASLVLGRQTARFVIKIDGEATEEPYDAYALSSDRAYRLAEFLQSRLREAGVPTLRSLKADLTEIVHSGIVPPESDSFEAAWRKSTRGLRPGWAGSAFSVPFSGRVFEFYFPWDRALEERLNYFRYAADQPHSAPPLGYTEPIPLFHEFLGRQRLGELAEWANTEAHLRLLCVGISLELKRREQADFDPNLAPGAIGVPDFVLRDPLSGQAFRFARIDGKWQPYSIGLDRRDDTGPSGRSNRYADDVTFGRLGEMSGQMRF